MIPTSNNPPGVIPNPMIPTSNNPPGVIPNPMIPTSNNPPGVIPNPMIPPSSLPQSNSVPQVPPSLWIPPMNTQVPSNINSSTEKDKSSSSIQAKPPVPVIPQGFALGKLVGPSVVNVSPEP